MAETGDENDWIFDVVMSVFKSPLWDAAIMGFVDENSIIFDNEEENKFVYTDIHTNFRELVENLLSQHLAELGLSIEMFADACEKSRYARDLNMEVYDQILAMDDFLTFKKLMVKRNMELELEAVRALQESGTPIVAPTNEEEAESTFQKALKESAEMSEAEVKEVLKTAAEEGAEPGAKGEPEPAELDAQYLQAMDANLMEMEILHKQEEMEQLELEQAIAMSLALEEERMKQAQDAAKRPKAQAPPKSQAAPSEEAKPLPPVSMQKSGTLTSAKLPTLEELQKQMDERRQQAQDAFKKNQEMLKQQREAQEALRQQAQVTEEAMQQRARHLKEQRDRIVAKKKAEREARAKKAQEAEELKKAQQAEKVAKMQASSGLGSPLGSPAKEEKGGEVAALDYVEERRRLMRLALARRMKQDLIEQEEERLTKLQAEQFNDLDRKLRLVENLRDENRRKEEQLNHMMKKQQQMRAKNVQRSAARAQMEGDDFAFAEG